MARIAPNKLTQDIFLDRVASFKNNLDFSKFQYIDNRTKGEVICPTHGSFFSIPSTLMTGSGCRKCAMIMAGANRKSKLSEAYFSKCKLMHNDKYEYSNSVYNGAHFPIDVICKIHGKFTCEANNHLRGSGCPKCGIIKIRSCDNFGGQGIYNQTRLNRNELDFETYLYIMYLYSDTESFYKIGISKYPSKRRAFIVRDSGKNYKIDIVFQKYGHIRDIFKLEQLLLDNTPKYVPAHKFGGHTECVASMPVITDIA